MEDYALIHVQQKIYFNSYFWKIYPENCDTDNFVEIKSSLI